MFLRLFLAILPLLSPVLALDASTKLLSSQAGRRVHSIFNPAANQSEATANRTAVSTKSIRIKYWGGRVLADGINVYLVWYGNWNAGSQKIIRTFISQLTEPPRTGNVGGWWNINSRYYGYSGYVKQKALKLAGEITDKYSIGSNLGKSGVKTIATNLVFKGKIPNDPRSLILVLTSADVKEGVSPSKFCSYCGWHSYYYQYPTYLFQYGFVGNAITQCPQNCIVSAVRASPPNGDRGADGMISVIAHELTETVTDPNFNAWYDDWGYENADICAWIFGTTSNYNLVSNSGKKYLVQKNWDPTYGYCTLNA